MAIARDVDWMGGLEWKGVRLAKVAAIALLSSSALTGWASPALAQENSDTGENSIVVTGSRIRDPNVASPSPVEVIGSMEFDLVGSSNVDEAINMLPQVTPRETSGNDLNGQGISTINLRGLGSTRTLTLVNGRRLVPSSTRGAVDVDNIPTMLVERVELVSGGASAVYGSDALAGVVNFILRKDFEGVQADGTYGISSRGDAAKIDAGLAFGTNFADNRGNVTLFATFTDRDGSSQADRAVHRVNVNGGSSTVPAGRIDNSPFNPSPTANQFFGSGGTTRTFVFENSGNLDPFVNALPEVDPDGDRYNFNPVNLLQSPLQRITIGAMGHLDLGGVTASVDLLYADNRTAVQFAESPLTNARLSPTNPILSQEARDLLALRPNPTADAIFSKRLSMLGPRRRDFNSDLYQATFSLDGSIGRGWTWEAFGSYGRTEIQSTVSGGASQSRINASLQGCPVGTQIFGCRLIDFFGVKPFSQDDIAYIAQTAVDTLLFERENVGVDLSGPLFALPAGEVQAAIGAEYRKDSSVFQPSDAAMRGDLAGFATVQPVAGSFDVIEGFAEIQVPLLEDQPFAHSLGLDLGARYSDYSSVGSVVTYKAGVTWEPIASLRLRSMYQRATRAPSLYELYQAGDRVFVNFSDPCARISPTGAPRPAPGDGVAQVCRIQGLPDPRTNATLTQADLTIDVDQLGSLNLREETSNTWTVGALFRPEFLPGASISVDYFNITIKDYIGRAFGGVNGAIASCFASGVQTVAEYNAHPACSLLYRDSAGRMLAYEPFANGGRLKTSGIDVGFDYSLPIGQLGDLRLGVNTTYLDTFDFDGVEYAGQISQNFGHLARWRANGRVTWVMDDLTVSAAWQHIGGVTEPISNERISSVDYFDLAARYSFTEALEFNVGVNNILDQQPPVIRNQLNNTDVHTYDLLGTYFYAGVRIRM